MVGQPVVSSLKMQPFSDATSSPFVLDISFDQIAWFSSSSTFGSVLELLGFPRLWKIASSVTNKVTFNWKTEYLGGRQQFILTKGIYIFVVS